MSTSFDFKKTRIPSPDRHLTESQLKRYRGSPKREGRRKDRSLGKD